MKIFILTINENYDTVKNYVKSIDNNAIVDRTRYKNRFHVRPGRVARLTAKKFKAKIKVFDYDLKKFLVW